MGTTESNFEFERMKRTAFEEFREGMEPGQKKIRKNSNYTKPKNRFRK